MKKLAEKIISFNKNLTFNYPLPNGIAVMNPFKESSTASIISEKFYKKFYNDNKERKLILGINPGRLGAGVTGIPFTDTKRLKKECGIPLEEFHTHEPSSVFVYEVIEAYGGPEQFYSDFYINSVCPLGFVIIDQKGKSKNYNYYDSAALTKAVTPFIIQSIREQIDLGVRTDVVYCLGTGKNYKYLAKLNEEQKFFGEVVPLEHPRYVMQYKSKFKEEYIDKFLRLLTKET